MDATAVTVSDQLLQVLSEHRFADLITAVSAPPGGPVAVGAKLLTDHSGSVWGSLGDSHVDEAVLADAPRLMAQRKSQVMAYAVPGGEVEVF
ncbi:MAG: XdhC family protein, partial [Betaproteobacteria bacterium]|nr:XdhC family protein [Betaproteobacteria bacterium]